MTTTDELPRTIDDCSVANHSRRYRTGEMSFYIELSNGHSPDGREQNPKVDVVRWAASLVPS